MGFSNKMDRKGFGFEYTVSNMFQSQGYFVRRGVPIQYGSTNQDATDVDVLGIMFTGLFQAHKIISDCKNKVRSKPYERIFWAKGLGEFTGASSVFVALNKTQTEIIKFASTSGVKVLTNDIISSYVDSNQPYGLADALYYEQYEKTIERASKRNVVINNIFLGSKRLYLYDNPYLALNIAINHLIEVAKGLQIYIDTSDDFNRSLRFLACELTAIIGLQLLQICSDVLGLPEAYRGQYIAEKLTFGEMDPNIILNVMRDATNLANEIIRSSVPKAVAPKKVDFGKITPPPYTDSIIGLVDRALAKPRMYLMLPQLLDFLLFEQGLKKEEHTEERFVEIFGFGMSDERVKASRNILAFVKSFCGIDWKLIWEKKDINKVGLLDAEIKRDEVKKLEEVEKKVSIVETDSSVNVNEVNEGRNAREFHDLIDKSNENS